MTELSFSDNLSSPNGCILQAERDIAKILGAYRSFILTDGSTSGVHAMLYAFRKLGGRKILLFENAHRSAANGVALLGLTPIVAPVGDYSLLSETDGVFVTTPDYYGNILPLAALRARCDREGKTLLVDGAHGGHLHFNEDYAGRFADLWVDGVHKSLPALTQGAVVSAGKGEYADALYEGVENFRTTSPSYPIMASVEYAVKYPRNEELEGAVRALFQGTRWQVNGDWTKVFARFGENAFLAQEALERQGIYPEFCDGEGILFYLSPAQTIAQIEELYAAVEELFKTFPYLPKKSVQRNHAPLLFPRAKTEWVPILEAEGRICARACGLFPPCIPLLRKGEKIEREKLALLSSAPNCFGLDGKKISVYEEEV